MVKRVRLVNIRSHVDTTVEFSTGVNLIEGDVGSGKTTILQSIESSALWLRDKEHASEWVRAQVRLALNSNPH